ncbi:MAG: Crp/Fnr family transcriptional regulator [Acidobacteriota bacterium]|nr:Crp/Fnr family transcriptional regulator [Acidobacteriota bacterium]
MDLSLIQKVPLFEGLSSEALERLLQATNRKAYPKDATIVEENEVGDTLYMILSGKVKVTNIGPDGKEVILSVLGDGEFFGEMSLLDKEPRSANVVSMEKTEMMLLRRKEFMNLLENNGEILSKLLAVLSSRLRHANAQIRSLALLDVLGRIARLLLDTARKEGRRLLDGSVVFRRPTHQEIASMVGTSRETVSRMIGDLSRDGYIKISGKDIIIKEKMEEAFPSS